MTSKSRAGRLGWEIEPDLRAGEHADPEIEAEVQAVADFFEALPIELRAYLDREARAGREGYPLP